MKKYISLLALALVFGVMTSCDSDPSDTDTNPGGTAVKKMCGDWIVTAYTCENQGDVANIDNWEWEELGSFSNYLLTYNTAANKSTEMWVDDNGELALSETDDYSHKVKVNVKYGKRTLHCQRYHNHRRQSAPQRCTQRQQRKGRQHCLLRQGCEHHDGLHQGVGHTQRLLRPSRAPGGAMR